MVKGRAYTTINNNNNNDDDDDNNKNEEYDGRRSALYTLHKCFSTILSQSAPIMPFIVEELWAKMYSSESTTTIRTHAMFRKEQMKEEVQEDTEMTKFTKAIIDFNSMVWNKKKETISKETGKPLSLKDPIDIRVPPELVQFGQDLRSMHNLTTR